MVYDMGRIAPTPVKRAARKLFANYKDKFGEDFSKNKAVVAELAEIHSKKLRNVVAGYVTRLVKQKTE